MIAVLVALWIAYLPQRQAKRRRPRLGLDAETELTGGWAFGERQVFYWLSPRIGVANELGKDPARDVEVFVSLRADHDDLLVVDRENLLFQPPGQGKGNVPSETVTHIPAGFSRRVHLCFLGRPAGNDDAVAEIAVASSGGIALAGSKLRR